MENLSVCCYSQEEDRSFDGVHMGETAELWSVPCNSSKVKYHIPTETHARPCLKERNKNLSACWVDLSWQSCDHTPEYKTAFCMSVNTEVDCVRPIGCHGSPTERQWFPWRVGVKSLQFRIQDHILGGLPFIFLDTLDCTMPAPDTTIGLKVNEAASK